uniref:Uncharacterized protein n=1 Tax=Arundo donax TaxID=35708 RepID=A0A0A8ZIG6_ARUDO
MSKACGRNS